MTFKTNPTLSVKTGTGPGRQPAVDRCSKCGFCLAACPVYSQYRTESASPRGKVQLTRAITQGRLTLSRNMQAILSRCLLCGSCSAACPSGVHGDRIFSGLRWEATRRYGIDWKKKAVYQALSRPWMMGGSARMAAWTLKHFGSLVKTALRDPFVRNRIPGFNHRPFSATVPQITPASGQRRARVLYFHGCATQYLHGQVGRSVLEVLPAMGVEVVTPKNQGCCGIPIFLSGARELSLSSIRNLVRRFDRDDADAVIVDCATCGTALRKEYVPLLQDLAAEGHMLSGRLLAGARRLADKTVDVMEFIQQHPDWRPLKTAGAERVRVTYHDPCHLVQGQGVGPSLRTLFQNLPGIDYIEMQGADTCCGGGGSFQFDHPDIASAITTQKAAAIRETGAQAVATGCPGCRMTISAGLGGSGKIRVIHPVEMIKDVPGGPKPTAASTVQQF